MLELLEDRLVLHNHYVVPSNIVADQVTTFATLSDALIEPGLTIGDIVQIEPGSTPGNVFAIDFAAAFVQASALTVQGDPGAGLSSIPEFLLSDATTIAAIDTLTLKNVNVGLVSTGALTFSGSGTIAGSTIVNINSTTSGAVTFAGTVDVLANSTVVNLVQNVSPLVNIQSPAGGSTNLISGNTFVSSFFTSHVVEYSQGSNSTVADKVMNNTFNGTAGVDISIQESITGLIIQDNFFRGTVAAAIAQLAPVVPKNLRIVGNTIQITGQNASGIELNGGAVATAESATITANVIEVRGTGNADGIDINVAAGTLDITIQGNDFHTDKAGVSITGSGSAAGIDLGGGTHASLGGNNFRSFVVAGTSSSGAIVTHSGTTGTIFAKDNIFFSGVLPATASFAGGASIDASINPTRLAGNAAFVETLYIDFLKRAGDTANPADAGNWINALNSAMLTQAQVASAISRSPESLGVLVDSLFTRILSRASDPGGRAGFVDLLGHGGTIEQVVATMVSSPEYAALTGSDGAFVQSVYNRLLGRVASNSEVSLWLGLLPSLGRTGMATTILSSGEFRVGAIAMLYGAPASLAPLASVASALPNLLDRSVVAALELNNWASSGLDLLTLEETFASTPEYFSNG
jgi:hypothetical protein